MVLLGTGGANGLQVRPAGHLRRHPGRARPHQQPPHPAAVLAGQARSLLEHRRRLCSGDPDSGGRQGESRCGVHLWAGGIVCLGIVAVAVFICGSTNVTSDSRMAYAFSRDGAMPFSRVWHRVNRHEAPFNAVWFSVAIAFVIALLSLGSQVAFQAMVSVATTGLYIAYALPILFRVTTARESFVPGPFHLGRRCSLVVGWVAVAWVALLTVLFSLPVAYPVAEANFNYTPVAVGGVLLLSVGAWVLHARFWFHGPVRNVPPAEVASIVWA